MTNGELRAEIQYLKDKQWILVQEQMKRKHLQWLDERNQNARCPDLSNS